MDSLFGAETPLAVRFFIAFIVVFALIGLTAWLIRRFGSGALGRQSSRGRAPRLAVIEAGAVDGRRKLVLIRRDNIEHLIMIGGPTDMVIEANIVRGQSARDTGPVRGTAESLPRPVPLGDEWPLQPEPAPRPARAPRPEEAQWSLPPEPPLAPVPAPAPAPAPAPVAARSRSADALAGLAAELSVQLPEPAAPPPPQPRPAPPVEAARPPKPVPSAATDQNLAEMAQRLEAALRRPAPAPAAPRPAAPPPPPKPIAPKPPAPKPAAEAPRVAPAVIPPKPEAPELAAAREAPKETPAPTVAPPAAPTVAAPPAAPVKPDDVFGSLEEEMASLLGRPAGKPS